LHFLGWVFNVLGVRANELFYSASLFIMEKSGRANGGGRTEEDNWYSKVLIC
jgi:hypothetical protein